MASSQCAEMRISRSGDLGASEVLQGITQLLAVLDFASCSLRDTRTVIAL